MAKRSSGEGNGGALVLSSKSSFFWGVVAGAVLAVAVCHFWCGRWCGHGMGGAGMSGCTYMEKMAPTPEGKPAPAK